MSTPAFRRSTPQVFSIGHGKFIAGLVWQSLSRPAAFMEEATGIAKELRFDLMLLLRAQGGVAQAGFSNSNEGGVKGAASIAAVIASRFLQDRAHASQMTSSCIGVFELPDQRWLYVAIRDSAILPQGDFVGTKTEVLEQLEKDYGMGEWDVVYGDPSFEHWGIDHFEVRKLDDMLPRKKSGTLDIKKSAILKEIDFEASHGVYWWAGAIVALVIAIAGATFGYQKWDNARKAEAAAIEAARRTAEAVAASRGIPAGASVAQPIHPWVAKPAPQNFAQACVREFRHITLGVWQLGQYVCTPSSVSYLWSADTWASPVGILDAVPKASVDLASGKASYSMPLALEAGGDDALGDMRGNMAAMANFLRTTGFDFRFGAAVAQPQRAWQEQTFTVSLGTLGPVSIATAIGKPGVRIEKIQYQNGEWQMEGTIYAN